MPGDPRTLFHWHCHPQMRLPLAQDRQASLRPVHGSLHRRRHQGRLDEGNFRPRTSRGRNATYSPPSLRRNRRPLQTQHRFFANRGREQRKVRRQRKKNLPLAVRLIWRGSTQDPEKRTAKYLWPPLRSKPLRQCYWYCRPHGCRLPPSAARGTSPSPPRPSLPPLRSSRLQSRLCPPRAPPKSFSAVRNNMRRRPTIEGDRPRGAE